MRHRLNNLFDYLSLDRASFSDESLGFSKVLSHFPKVEKKGKFGDTPNPA